MSKISASHILVDHEHEATDLVAKLNSGTSFEDLAMNFSKCPSGKKGGALGDFGRGMMVKPFEEAAFALEVGSVSDVVKTQFGHHLIKRTK
jgi:peptidyl-prolyl cis-trans isomerase C